ncbi:MAG: SDR family NAD(P)-dependent oxidoreductase [Gammaproteobacteria bacterium]|nr:SDR family NAD(P)-dependent oxidoreductase [Gammaproteobacteria bacterium]
MKRIIIVGATSAIAEYCMREWQATEPVAFVLVGRNQAKLDAIAQDLKVRQPLSTTQLHLIDFQDAQAIEAFANACYQAGQVDLILIAHGWLGEQSACQDALPYCKTMLEVNALSPLLFAEAFAKHLEKAGQGQLVLIGSVAGDRGRKSNYVYGAAKACIDAYAQGLQHRFAKTKVKISIVKPGPTATPMTAHLENQNTFAPVNEVAKQIVKSIAKGKPVVYAPAKWKWIMLVIRWIPRAVFARMDI